MTDVAASRDPTGPDDARARLDRLLEDDPADLYENAPCGYLSSLPDGTVVRVNRTFCTWTGRPVEEVLGRRFQELLTVGGQVFHETHLAPLLRMQGAVQEIALDVLRVDGTSVPCLLNAVEVRDEAGRPVLVRATLFEATARRRYERELLAARQAAEESEARSRQLQAVVSDLAAATSVDDVAAVIVEHGRRALHAAGAALLVVDDGPADPAGPALRVLRSAGLGADLLAALREAAGGRLALELAQGLRSVPLDDRLRAGQPSVAAAMARDGLTSLVVVPVSGDGPRRGAVVLGLRPAGDGLISLEEPAEEVRPSLPPADVDLLWTLGRQAGQALERAELHERTARQAERAAFLLDAARLLAGAAGVDEVVERLVRLAVPRLADVFSLDLVTEAGLARPAVRHGDPARQALVDELRSRHLPARPAAHPAVRALEQARTQWLPELSDPVLEQITDSERHRELIRELELRSLVSVPLVVESRVLGVITLCGDRHRPRFGAADVETAEQLALQVALVVDKAQRYELDARTSHTLQAGLLPPAPPQVQGLATAVRYLAATRGVEVGGDFYDVVPLPDASVALAVGDVVGHDITAAATMGQLRSVYRALLGDERPPPGAVIDRLQAGWPVLGLSRMATALFATLDVTTGRLRMASAGHLAPLLLTDGHAELLPVRPTRMLGAPPAGTPAPEWAGVLPPGATLVLYTDGLVESRSADLDEGLDRLLATAARCPAGDPGELCDRLLGELAGAHRADDIALLALTRLG
jgi:PAS domain S-box-containing protein